MTSKEWISKGKDREQDATEREWLLGSRRESGFGGRKVSRHVSQGKIDCTWLLLNVSLKEKLVFFDDVGTEQWMVKFTKKQ